MSWQTSKTKSWLVDDYLYFKRCLHNLTLDNAYKDVNSYKARQALSTLGGLASRW
jgi:hypothetical protein